MIPGARNRRLLILETRKDRQSRRIVVACVKCEKLPQDLIFCPTTDKTCPMTDAIHCSIDVELQIRTGSDLQTAGAVPPGIELLGQFSGFEM